MKKLYIAFVGRRNAGKSSMMNLITGQNVAIVSDTPGTTTDPVKKSYEIPGFANAVLVDTAGIDDFGELGTQRISKTKQSLLQSDIAVFVFTDNKFDAPEKEICEFMISKDIPFIMVHNKCDQTPLNPTLKEKLEQKYKKKVIDFSVADSNPDLIIEAIKNLQLDENEKTPPMLGDLLKKNDIVLLIAPIDSEAPTGRLILPQVQVMRDVLDNHCIAITLQPEELPHFLSHTGLYPRLAVTDSQVFKHVSDTLPLEIPLTSFSIIMARHKGYFEEYIAGTRRIDGLLDGDNVLIMESCSHQVSCEDIGRVKLPAMLGRYTGKKLNFTFISGLSPIEDFEKYSLVIQCGGCMVTPQQLRRRISPFVESHTPVSNYGMAIAFMNGIFERSVEIFQSKN
ncbi:MAG: [FeFe] hydrogenase H-cluster maturation GTPase HydF [Culturomica sp.]|jgi:[FeFe] hydrogenase H-cluster maturation GTPase HydF|nr:[FeFe] hydrogenase H-cluster maturation GTPase HydF [Culturomica sp.]